MKRLYTAQRWGGKHKIYHRGQVETAMRRGVYACRDDSVASVMVDKSVWKGISNADAVSLASAVYDRCEFEGAATVKLNTLHAFIDAVTVSYDGPGSVKALVNNVQERLAREAALGSESETVRKQRADALRGRIKDLKDRGWPDETVDLILAGGVSLGMTPQQVVESWGPPCRLVQTVDSTTSFEEWVYGHSGAKCDGKPFLRFRGGVVVRIQD